MSLRILVTGASGRLGKPLATALRAAGHRVTGLDAVAGPETQVVGSIANRSVVDRAFAFGIDAVIHTAALHEGQVRSHPARAFIDVNVGGTLNLLEAAKAGGATRFVLTSTPEVMVDPAASGDAAHWLDGEGPCPTPTDIHAVSRLGAEQLCAVFARKESLASVILRPARFSRDEGLTARTAAAEGRVAAELLHARVALSDVVTAHLSALERAPAIGWGNYVVSAPPPFAREEAAQLRRSAAEVIARHYPEARALFAARDWSLPMGIAQVLDPARTTRDLGWRAVTDFASLLDAMREGRALPEF